VRLGKPLTPGSTDDRAALWVIRRHDMYRNLPSARLVELFWKQRGQPGLFSVMAAAE
jgi:hypothetical protein